METSLQYAGQMLSNRNHQLTMLSWMALLLARSVLNVSIPLSW